MSQFNEPQFIRDYTGDPERAFRRLMDGFRDRVYLFCLRAAASREDAEDMAQEVFIRVWKGLGRFRGECSLATWIYRIAWNVCASYLERRARSPGFDPYDESPDGEETVAPPIPLDDERLRRSEQRQFLERLLASIPESYRLVLTLYYLQEQSYQEIAAITGMPMGTVKASLHRAKARLRAAALKELGMQ